MISSDNIKSGLMLAAVGAVAYIAWKAYKGAGTAAQNIAEAAKTVGGWVNPMADTNLAYQGVNAIGAAVTGNANYSLGGAIYDSANGGALTGKTDPSTWSLNPASERNPYYLSANALGANLTGDVNWNLGGAVYDATHGPLADQVAASINPASDKNLVYRGVSATGEAITGQPGWSLGGQIYDWTH